MEFDPDDKARMRSYFAREAANARHSKSNGAKEKRAKMIAAWKSGKYTSKNICAEQECAALGMSYHAARRALYNV
ncbi:hypothetical protein [Aquitalea pelogenes]|uniref:hypothetical protein n=1 Tax=Aquitalea pelogenes TaxID=1293573 RepID=UPI0035B0EF72